MAVALQGHKVWRANQRSRPISVLRFHNESAIFQRTRGQDERESKLTAGRQLGIRPKPLGFSGPSTERKYVSGRDRPGIRQNNTLGGGRRSRP
jgi:hypothetical protein